MADIEKESLEAHVELCAERYKSLHDKLAGVNSRLDKQEVTLQSIHQHITKNESGRNKQLISWAGGIIATLCAALGAVVFTMLN